MKSSKIAFVLLFINLLTMGLLFTTKTGGDIYLILLFFNIPMVVLLFLVRENFLEFLKYILYLVVFAVAYSYFSSYITYRDKAYLEKREKENVFTQKYKKECRAVLTNEKELKKKVDEWDSKIASLKKEQKLNISAIDTYKTILFFMNANNKIDKDMSREKIAEKNKTALGKVHLKALNMAFREHIIVDAIKEILTLTKEEQALYKKENICHLSQKYKLLEEIKKEAYEEKEVNRFLLERCEGY